VVFGAGLAVRLTRATAQAAKLDGDTESPEQVYFPPLKIL
jgi:hypothetical protein